MQGKVVSGIRSGFLGFGSDELVVAPTSPIRQDIQIHQSDIANNSGSDAIVGYGAKLVNADWKAGQWDDGATPEIIDDTADAQSATINDFALTTTTNADGHVISAKFKFGLVGYTVSTASVGSPVYVYEYWNGTAWTAFTPIVAPTFSATGETALVFAEPAGWAKGGDSGDELDATHYHIAVRATTAPSTAPLAAKLWVVRLLDLVGKVTDGSTINRINNKDSTGSRVYPGEALVPYCSVSSSKNIAYFEYDQV